MTIKDKVNLSVNARDEEVPLTEVPVLLLRMAVENKARRRVTQPPPSPRVPIHLRTLKEERLRTPELLEYPQLLEPPKMEVKEEDAEDVDEEEQEEDVEGPLVKEDKAEAKTRAVPLLPPTRINS